MNKKSLTERDICTKHITPALAQAQWDVLSQIREQAHFTKGSALLVRGLTHAPYRYTVMVR